MYQRELDWPAYRSKSWQHPCCCSRFTSTTHVAVLAASVSPRATTDAQFAIHRPDALQLDLRFVLRPVALIARSSIATPFRSALPADARSSSHSRVSVPWPLSPSAGRGAHIKGLTAARRSEARGA